MKTIFGIIIFTMLVAAHLEAGFILTMLRKCWREDRQGTLKCVANSQDGKGIEKIEKSDDQFEENLKQTETNSTENVEAKNIEKYLPFDQSVIKEEQNEDGSCKSFLNSFSYIFEIYL